MGESQMPKFNMIRGFGHIYHRYLNSTDRIESLAIEETGVGGAGQDPSALDSEGGGASITPVAEGDVCWYEKDEDVLAVMYHPKGMNQIPSRTEMLRKVRCGEVIRLEEVLKERFAHVPKVFELKKGVGSTQVALSYVLDCLEAHCEGSYWIDAFSPRLLRMVKHLNPRTPTSLHTRFGVYGPIVLKTAFEVPPISPKFLSSLSHVDAVSVTFKYSPVRALRHVGWSIDDVHKWVYRAGKDLILGGVEDKQIAYDAKSSRAIAAYRHWEK